MTKLEEYMKENNLSIKQLAEKCNVRANKIERLIAGKDFRNAPLVLYNIAITTKIRVDDLLGL